MTQAPGMPAIQPGEIVAAKFRVGRVIGRGGMSVVYEAKHVQLGQHVAVKVLGSATNATRGAFERALIEAQATARLTSEHVVRVFDVGTTTAGHAYVVMEKLNGRDLAQALRSGGGRMSVAEAVAIVLQAIHALAEAHGSGIVHRDVKPSNLFLAERPDRTVCVKVLDFGLARADARDPNALSTSTMPRMAGSPGYASPEQLGTASDFDARADVWGLGVVLYELVAGHRPFDAPNLTDALIAASTLPMPPITSEHGPVPGGFEQVVQRCLEKDRESRFASLVELADALEPYAPPAFAHYPERIRDVGRRAAPSMGRITLPDGPASAGGHHGSSDSDLRFFSKNELNTDAARVGAPPLVTASLVPPPRNALRIAVAAGVAVVLGFVLLAGRSAVSPARTASQAAAIAASSSSGLGPLPPLAAASATAFASPEIAAKRAVTSADESDGRAGASAANPPQAAARPQPPRGGLHPATGPAPKNASVPPPGKDPAGNPMTYR